MIVHVKQGGWKFPVELKRPTDWLFVLTEDHIDGEVLGAIHKQIQEQYPAWQGMICTMVTENLKEPIFGRMGDEQVYEVYKQLQRCYEGEQWKRGDYGSGIDPI